MGEKFESTQMLKSSAEEVFDGNLADVVWHDENNNPVGNIGECLKKKQENKVQESIKKYSPLGTVVSLKKKIGLYMIIGYKYKKDDVLFDYLAVRYPVGITPNTPMHTFNHNEITKFHHLGMSDSTYKAFKETLLKEDSN